MDTTTGTRDDTGSPTAVETVRWVSARPGGLVIERGERPRPGPGQARVRSVLVGICGSDLHAVAGRHPFVPLPYRPGHEVVGVVEEIGGDVHLAVSAGVAGRFGPGRVRVGDRVVVEPTLNCGDCKQCRRGVVNLCERLDFFGCGHSQGGMAEEFVVRTDRLHVVPPEMSDLQAALVEPLSTPVHAVRLAAGAGAEEEADLSGRSVVVLGAGTIGLLVLAAARWAGAQDVVVTDVLPAKRERAARLGAATVVDAAAHDVVDRVRGALGESADVVFDCVGVQATVDQALRMALKGGTVVVVGVPEAPVTLDLAVLQDQQVRLQGSATYLGVDYATSMWMIEHGAVRPEDLITLVVSLDDVEAGFGAARSGDHVKVLIRP